MTGKPRVVINCMATIFDLLQTVCRTITNLYGPIELPFHRLLPRDSIVRMTPTTVMSILLLITVDTHSLSSHLAAMPEEGCGGELPEFYDVLFF
jgi:hypothetical protein